MLEKIGIEKKFLSEDEYNLLDKIMTEKLTENEAMLVSLILNKAQGKASALYIMETLDNLASDIDEDMASLQHQIENEAVSYIGG